MRPASDIEFCDDMEFVHVAPTAPPPVALAPQRAVSSRDERPSGSLLDPCRYLLARAGQAARVHLKLGRLAVLPRGPSAVRGGRAVVRAARRLQPGRLRSLCSRTR
jgi:hypothetical protein